MFRFLLLVSTLSLAVRGDEVCDFISDSNDVCVPSNCVTWFDGCNTCSVEEESFLLCTTLSCEVNQEPSCQLFDDGGEIIEGEEEEIKDGKYRLPKFKKKWIRRAVRKAYRKHLRGG